ncbi:hypothetical protein Ciccas_002578 [Cichlidogyrus casuarinus]|uniref:Uncharacterized protein n=1 Tax=Cichlidogyrus casuarinus TaxID=1844966 RepID=A0ABD2QGT5_9PLAT
MSVKITSAEWNSVLERLDKLETKNKTLMQEKSELEAKIIELEEKVDSLENKVKENDLTTVINVLKSTNEEMDAFTVAELKKTDALMKAITGATRHRIEKENQLIAFNVNEEGTDETLLIETIKDATKIEPVKVWRIGKRNEKQSRPVIIKMSKRISYESMKAVNDRLFRLKLENRLAMKINRDLTREQRVLAKAEYETIKE